MSNAYIPDQLHHMSKKELLEFAQTAHGYSVELNARLAKANERVEDLSKAVLEEIVNRDEREKWLDKISGELSRYFGVDIGEHSSANNPWLEAFEAIPEGALNKFAIEQRIAALESLKDEWIKKASEMPHQLECRSKGSSCYNWAMYYARELTDKAEQLRKEQENGY